MILLARSAMQRRFPFHIAQRSALSCLALILSFTGRAAPGSEDPNFKLFVIQGKLSDLDVQSDGKLIVAGDLRYDNGAGSAQLLRLNLDGTVDRSFPALSPASGAIHDVRVQPEGKILVAGTFTEFAGAVRRGLVRLHRDGTVDQSFQLPDSTGPPDRTITTKPDGILAIYPDGRMLAANDGLIRLNADGTRDFTFFPFRNELGFESPTILPDGRILLLIGTSHSGSVGTFYSKAIIRLLPDGRPDSGFPRAVGYSPARGPIVLSPDGAFFIRYTDGSAVLFTRHLGDPFPTSGNAIVEWASDVFSAQEMAGKAEVVLYRRGNIAIRVVTGLEPVADTTSPVTVLPESREVVFEPGEWHRVVALGINDDPQITGPRTVRISLTQSGTNATLGSRTNALIKIDDVYPEFAIKEPAYWFFESDAGAAVEVIRHGRINLPVVLPVEMSRVAPGPAVTKIGEANVVFAPGETQQLFHLGLKDDSLSEPDERLRLTLIQTAEGQYRVSRNESEFAVLDDDRPGSLDAKFRMDPRVRAPNSPEDLLDVVPQPDGGIVLVMVRFRPLATRLIRLLEDGTLDEKFHSELPVELPISRIVAQKDGRLVVATTPPNPLLLRLMPDGRIDASFKMQEGPKLEPGELRSALWMASDDSILLQRSHQIERLKPDGARDMNFIPVKIDPSERTLHLLNMPSSNIVLMTGYSGGIGSLIEELLPNGTRIRSMKAPNPTGMIPGLAFDFMALQSDGRIVVITRLLDVSEPRPQGWNDLQRWNADLTPDESFSAPTLINPTPANSQISAVLIQPDDKIVLLGHFPPSLDPQSARIVRLNPNGSIDTSFDTGVGFDFPPLHVAFDHQGRLLAGGGSFSEFAGLRLGYASLIRLNLAEPFRIASAVREKTGEVRLRVSIPFSQKAWIEVSENLSEWTRLNEITTTGIPGEFLDREAANRQGRRFYRARLEE